jgi:hypothetical protein
LPFPGEPLVIVIHAALLVAVQLHPVAALTVIVPVPAVDGGLADVGETVGEQVTPDWFTVNVLPPIDTVPVREVVAVFAATVYEKVPLPVPVAPAVIVIQASLLVADQPHPADALTVTMLEPPDAAVVVDVGESADTQGTPACVTVNVWPPIVIVPVRELVLALAATL